MESWDQEYENFRQARWVRQRRALCLILIFNAFITPLIQIFSTPQIWWAFFLPTLTILFLLTLDNGNPLRWWALFTGVEIKVDLDKISREEAIHGFDSMRPKIQEWLKETTPKYQYIMINPYRYKFLRKRHAAMFKLAWG